LRADPAYYPNGYYYAASLVGSRRCQPCLPAVLGLLKLEKLGASIPEHALHVDLDMGFLFAIGPYGSGARDALIDATRDPGCIVRKNAVKVARTLLDPGAVPAIRTVALQDGCVEARREAWTTLGVLGDPQLGELVQQRLSSPEVVPKEEKLAMIDGLGSLYRPMHPEIRERLSRDPDKQVAAAATELIAAQDDPQNTVELLRNVGSKSSTDRTKVTSLLRSAIENGRFEFNGSAFDLEASLTADDLPAVNEARASVLRRQSDECLHEWKKLYLTGTLLLVAAQQSPAPAPR
jgi:HEAT repeat protein